MNGEVESVPELLSPQNARFLLDSTEAFLFDCDGVIWKGDKLIDGVSETLDLLRSKGKKLVFVTNNSMKSRRQYAEKFNSLGIAVGEDEIFSSSFAAAMFLKVNDFPREKKVYVIGCEGILEELQLAGFTCLGGSEDGKKTVELKSDCLFEHDKSVGAVVVGLDPYINYYKLQYGTICIRENPGCLFIATNLDAVGHMTDLQEWPGAGCMVGAIASSTEMKPTVVGKPSTFMMDFLLQKSRRKKNASSGESLESTAAGQGSSDGKRALYHCNYCNKDITGKIRIKCAVCPDFDLCIECFSVGAEVTPHKSNHPYRVMDNLSFPLICPDWNADDEILLLEGIEMYGLGNWTEVAEHVGTKSKELCIEHFANVYLNSPYFPLPDLSHVVGKNRKDLLAMAKGHSEDKKGFSLLGELTLKEESSFSPSRVKVEDTHKGGSSGRLLSSLNADVDSSVRSSGTNVAATAAVKKASNMAQVKDGPNVVKVEDPQIDRNFGGKKPNSGAEGSSLIELSGYNSKRHEFDPEYDNDAEQLLAEMEFKDPDTEDERELKLRVLRIYGKRLDERKRRKDFILERNLLHPNPFEKDLSPEEKELCRRYDVFMRFHSKEEHDDLLKTIVAEHRNLKRIQELKEARAAGCRTSAEADRYLEQKRRRKAEENARRVKESAQGGPSGLGAQNVFIESVGKDANSRTAGQATSSFVNDFDVIGFPEAELLSENEKRLCSEIRLAPAHYLKMQETLSVEIFKGNVTKKSDAHRLFKVEPSKVDRVYDMLAKKGIAQL